jgi:transcription antitermination protein NusB
MKSRSDPRHNARKLAVASVFCWLFSEQGGENSELISQELLDTNNCGTDYDKELSDFIAAGVKEHLSEIDNIIQESAPEWPLDKIAKVDLVILRVAIFEVVYGKKAPVKVAIDEAVELAKEFGNETSHKFVNGVLGTVAEKYV